MRRPTAKELTMNVSDLMTTPAKSCGTNDDLQRAAQIMWENDCGSVPVVDSDGRVVGMITDRDICMAAYTHGQPLWQIPVHRDMANHVHSVRELDPLEVVEKLMRRVQVLGEDGHLKGILSMNDLARHGHRTVGRKTNGLSGDSVLQTLAAVCDPHPAARAKEPTA
jgi:predicted transcriptional regulator